MNNNNDVKSTFAAHDMMEREWRIKFNELCYEVFYKNSFGAQLLAHLENKYFRSPVAFPNREPSWAFFNEGQNEMIRSFTAGIQGYVALNSVKARAKDQNMATMAQKRKASTKPI